MPTNTELKKFAQSARRQLREQVAARLEQVLGVDSVEVREKASAVAQLRQQLAVTSKAEVIDRVAYTWFNRFCALRYMDVNHYTNVGVVSPAAGNTQPEILQEAKAGFINEDLKNYVTSKDVFDLLSGAKPSANPQQEAYRLLLVGVCNSYFKIMPFMFEEIADYTELLMPLDLLSENSILFHLREVLTEEACQDVEVIGWLYQYYISERKDEVFEALKKNQKIEAKDIPAATQLFTPHWIVRYLVENSLGRLWLLNKPKSKLAEKMDYYIQPVDVETDFLEVASAEELKICDPACGSGHMLTYAFDLLYSIYEEEGYEPASISSLILQKNLFGIEIDGRAGALAAFALAMKARGKDKRFFTRNIQPNVCVLENVSFTDQEIQEYINAVGRDLFTEPLLQTLKQFEQAKNIGSLIQPVLTNPAYNRQVLEGKNLAGNLFLFGIHERVLKVLKQCEYLSSKYHVVVANPPYMNSSGMNEELRNYLSDNFSSYKTDLFSAFIVRNLDLTVKKGQLGFMSPFVWMFLSSYEELRLFLIKEKTITTLIQLEYSGFEGATVPICSFTIENHYESKFYGGYVRLSDFRGPEIQSSKTLEAIHDSNCRWFYRAQAIDFLKIPNSPIVYWISNSLKTLYDYPLISTEFVGKEGVGTRNDEVFMKMFWEVSINQIGRNKRWILTDKAGGFRKWYMGFSFVMDWENDGYRIKNYRDSDGSLRSRPQNISYLFQEGVSWGKIGSGFTSFRWRPSGYGFNDAAPALFGKNVKNILPQLNSMVTRLLLSIRGATLNVTTGVVAEIPIISTNEETSINLEKCTSKAVEIEKWDWDNFEISVEFSHSPILLVDYLGKSTLEKEYSSWCFEQERKIYELCDLEQNINNEYIKACNLQSELSAQIPPDEITLTCNPLYRYGNGKTEEEYKRLQLADTMKEFISYAVGCMFGRYSLDKPGLVLANQGETLQDYLRQVPVPTFLPDEDNVIPVIGGDWFQDDISERFKKFLKVTFGEEHYSENLQFIEEAVGRDIESYFLKDFYDYHVKMYKKRPIYWMFSSPKGTFNALIYMHRYNKDTVSILLNDYLRQFRVKLESRKVYLEKLSISASSSQSERTLSLKELETLKKQLEEITAYENKVIFPLATRQIEIDLDDGVKANYPKFGDALAEIKGL
ncbi:MAG: BREX-1 system adenine-specific DNA-methyltransferase PglX [Anaerolineaceae bacterium]